MRTPILIPTLALTALCGTAAPAMGAPTPHVQPELAPRGTMQSELIAHIYYNIATGEKVATLLGGARPADNNVSPAVWIADNTAPCADFGITSTAVGTVDNPDCTTCFSSTATGQIFLDWGDIPADTVIDCVGVEWNSCLSDTDANGDGIGDGVEGFGATWTWFDAENGFDSSDTRLPLVSLTLHDLPAWIDTGTTFCELHSRYTATIDLAGTCSSSMVFEIGDTDSFDGSGSGLFNPGAGADLDSDGLADFGYALQYIQPGTVDFDGDGVPDGDPAAADTTAWTLVTGNGDVSFDGTIYTPETDVPGAQGIEDAFDIFIDVDRDGVLEPIGTFWYGGFVCADPGVDPFDPFAQFYMQMYGPGAAAICPADIYPSPAPDGHLDFFDVNAYITAFNDGDLSIADFYPACGDGQLNFFDVITFLSCYNAGCP